MQKYEKKRLKQSTITTIRRSHQTLVCFNANISSMLQLRLMENALTFDTSDLQLVI